MKLTRRQETFFDNLLDLYLEIQGPIHYTALAERVGVSSITAYDMLRLLEEKGYVKSDYQLAADKPGPGRAVVVFWPTKQAEDTIAMMLTLDESGDWEKVKERVLDHVQSVTTEASEEYQLAWDMLPRIPPDGPPAIRYCTEVISVIALRLRHLQVYDTFVEYLPLFIPDSEEASEADFDMFGGFVLGLLASDDSVQMHWIRELLEHVKHSQRLAASMDEENRQMLTENIHCVLTPNLQHLNQPIVLPIT